MAELRDHDCLFAVKCLKKHTVIEDDDVESIMIERKVLAFGSTNPFICKLFCTFQTEVSAKVKWLWPNKAIDYVNFELKFLNSISLRVICFLQWNGVLVVILCFTYKKKANFLKIKRGKQIFCLKIFYPKLEHF